MTLKEMLNTPGTKKIYRELMKKHHPDVSKRSPEMAKQITKDAREMTDEQFLKKYNTTAQQFRAKSSKESYNDLNEKKDVFWKKVAEWTSKLNNESGGCVFFLPKKTLKGDITIEITAIPHGEKRPSRFMAEINRKKIKTFVQFLDHVMAILDKNT